MSALATGRAPTILTRTGARRKTDRCREVLARGSVLLVELFHGQAWTALGYDTWGEYTAAEFGNLHGIRLEVPDRIELVVGLTRPLAEGGQGMSRRAVAGHLGVSVGTVQHDLELAGVIDLTEQRAARRAVVEPATPAAEPPPAVSKRDRAVQLVAEQGVRGLTSLELAEVTGWTGGSASGTLSDLKRQRRVTPTTVFRRGFAAYVVPNPVEVT